MAKEKYPGAGATVECDLDGTETNWTLFGFTESITPPPRERNEVDAGNLDEDLDNTEPGTEARSDLEFVQVWDPSDGNDGQIDTLFNSKAKPTWRITYPTTTPVTDTFKGWVRLIAPEQIIANNRIGRGVTVRRTSDITRA